MNPEKSDGSIVNAFLLENGDLVCVVIKHNEWMQSGACGS